MVSTVLWVVARLLGYSGWLLVSCKPFCVASLAMGVMGCCYLLEGSRYGVS